MDSDWKIDKKLVERVAKVARLELSDEEVKKFTKQFSDILNACEELNQVNTEGVQPSFHPQELKNVWREDEVEAWEWDPLSNTKHKEKNYFKGPRIV